MTSKDLNRFQFLISRFTTQEPKLDLLGLFGTDRHPVLQDWVADNLIPEVSYATADEILESSYNILKSGLINGTD